MTCPAVAGAERSVAKNLLLVAAMPRCHNEYGVRFYPDNEYSATIMGSLRKENACVAQRTRVAWGQTGVKIEIRNCKVAIAKERSRIP